MELWNTITRQVKWWSSSLFWYLKTDSNISYICLILYICPTASIGVNWSTFGCCCLSLGLSHLYLRVLINMLILHCKSTYFQFAYFIILQANKYHLRQVIESELQRSSLAKTQPNNNPRKIRSLNTDFLPRKHPPVFIMCDVSLL
jgi:hypothetical protein